jgi:aminoglycoside phosphotransferase (APT) family kinase protein
MSTAAARGLVVEDAVVLNDSNKLTLRLLPCDVLARVAPSADQVAQLEIDLARRLADESPVALLDPRVEPLAHERDGFVITLWSYYPPAAPVGPTAYARALARLHAGLRALDIAVPHVSERVERAQRLLADRDRTPALADADRELLTRTLRRLRRVLGEHGGAVQLLHGEPHPGNLLSTTDGPRFIDFETCCRGPVEFDLAHAPDEVGDHYPGVDHQLLSACRLLVLAMITTWRWDRDDELPDGRRLGEQWLAQLRAADRA